MKHPVLIVGAGPTGLALALTLKRFNIDVRIIDEQKTAHHESRSLAVHARTLEIFEDFQIAQQAIEKGQKITNINLYFNGQKKGVLNFGSIKTPFPFILILPQCDTEHLLLGKLHEYDLRVERGTTLIGLKTGSDHVSVTLEDELSHKQQQPFSWVIGCDGMHSHLRRYIGAEYLGYAYPMQFSLADVDMKTQLSENEVHCFMGSEGAQVIIPIQKSLFRIISQKMPEEKSGGSLHDLEKKLHERAIGQCQIQEVEWMQNFKIHHRLATIFRRGRLFIAGDAAHVHSPVGGQGMNLGIQDAYNLGWKLAYVVKHQAKTKLLASYAKERKLIAKQVLANTEKITGMMTRQSSFSHAYFSKITQWISKLPAFNSLIAYQFSGLAQKYKQSPIIQSTKRKLFFIPAIGAGMRFVNAPLKHAQNSSSVQSHQLAEGVFHHLFIFFKASKYVVVRSLKDDLENAYPKILKIHLVCTQKELTHEDCWMDENLLQVRAYKIGLNFLLIVRPDKVIGMLQKGFKKKHVEHYFEALLGS